VSLSDYLLGSLGIYGPPLLFGVLLVGSIGVPTPATLLLIAAGAFAQQGEMSMGWTVAMAATGTIIGDNIGYALGRWGSTRFHNRLSRLAGGEERLQQTQEWLNRRGGVGIFLSRWLITPLGPVINLTSGMSGYSWGRFLILDLTGELLWVILYVVLGAVFSDRIQALGSIVDDIAWTLVSLVAAIALGWMLVRRLRPGPRNV
jgi:membrane-associated protein